MKFVKTAQHEETSNTQICQPQYVVKVLKFQFKSESDWQQYTKQTGYTIEKMTIFYLKNYLLVSKIIYVVN